MTERNHPLSPVVQALLTDLYEINMAYAYWRSGKHNEPAVFDLFIRNAPFKGEFVVFAGLSDCVEFVKTFRFTDSDITYLKSVLPPTTDDKFYDYLRSLNCSEITLRAVAEGTVVFPRVPLLIVEGPLAVCQLLETTLLNLINYATLICTNAARFRLASGPKVKLIEFGLRRAQGPDGGMSASRYSYIGGFDGTSNVLAGKMYGIPIQGTMAHSLVSSFEPNEDLRDECRIMDSSDEQRTDVDFFQLTRNYLHELLDQTSPILPGVELQEVSAGELRSFVAYAASFPHGFLALIDTYDVLKSGLPNFCATALALNELGYRATGIRLDSGDLAFLSKNVRLAFQRVAAHFRLPWFAELTIVASNDINEETVYSLKAKGHKIDCFGVGTHLVTCQKQPALGCVYKLVELSGTARISLYPDIEEVAIPGRKKVYRLYSKDGTAINDLMSGMDEPDPLVSQPVLCRHPFLENFRAMVTPSRIEVLHKVYWQNGRATYPTHSVGEIKETVQQSLNTIRNDVKRYLNPTPYKVSLSKGLYDYFHSYWLRNAPIGQLE